MGERERERSRGEDERKKNGMSVPCRSTGSQQIYKRYTKKRGVDGEVENVGDIVVVGGVFYYFSSYFLVWFGGVYILA